MPFRGTSKCFYYNIFRIELRCEWVNTKNLEFFMECCYIPVLLWKRVSMVYEIFDKLPNVTNMINCLITRKPLNLDKYIILSLNRK